MLIDLRMMVWEWKLLSKGLWDIFWGMFKVFMLKYVCCCVFLCINNFLKFLVYRFGDIVRF